MSDEKPMAAGVLPRGMLRRNYGKGGAGGSWFMRLRIIFNPHQVADVFELGLSTRDFDEAQQRALNLLNALDVIGIRYCFSLHLEDGKRVEYDDLRAWKCLLRRKLHQKQASVTPEPSPCKPELPGLESFCKT